MKRYENDEFKKSMRLRYDYNNCMTHRIGIAPVDARFERKVGAIEPQELAQALEIAQKAKKTLRNKWGRPSRMMAWGKLPFVQKSVVADIIATAERIRRDYEAVVVFGIGGSALGPIAVQYALNHLRYNELPQDRRGGPKFYVEDNVDPERMTSLLDIIDPQKTCFIVTSKSGSTSETMSQVLIVFDILKKTLSEKDFSRQVIAITDKAKGNMVQIAHEYGLKKFIVPDGVGGRFSELCPVGLLPAAVCGIDIEEMLAGAAYMDELCAQEDITKNPGYMAALVSYLMMKKGKNIQVMMPYADSLRYMSDWFVQLWAESLGKKFSVRGKAVHTGQTPVKAIGVTDQHSVVQLFAEGPFDKLVSFIGVDRYRSEVVIPEGFSDMPNINFLCGHTLNELIQSEQQATALALVKQGKVNQTITIPEVNAFTIGELLYFFMVETAVCGEMLGIDAFDQPGVEEGKVLTYAMLGRPGFDGTRDELKEFPKAEKEYII